MSWYAEGVRFDCQRCGNCCSGRGSVVRVSRRERAALARFLGLSIEDFEAQHTRATAAATVLLDKEGSAECEWLDRRPDGLTGCRVNDAKPDQCRSYPFWPGVLRDQEAWDAEGAKCRGIGAGPVIPPEEVDRRAGLERFREAVETLFVELDAELELVGARCWASGNCCDFPNWGHRLFTSRVEAERFAEGVDLSTWDPESGLCPAWKDRRCTAREQRPFACRSYYCDPVTEERTQDVTERYITALKSLHERHRVPWDYRDWIDHLRSLRPTDNHR